MSQINFEKLLDEAGLGYDAHGPCESISADRRGDLVRLYDDWSAAIVPVETAIEVLREIVGHEPTQALELFWSDPRIAEAPEDWYYVGEAETIHLDWGWIRLQYDGLGPIKEVHIRGEWELLGWNAETFIRSSFASISLDDFLWLDQLATREGSKIVRFCDESLGVVGLFCQREDLEEILGLLRTRPQNKEVTR